MHAPNDRGQVARKARAAALPPRRDESRNSRFALALLALLALLGLATLWVAGATTALSQGHALRLATEWRL
jgi:hypothetical protein